jgi:ssDNA-binding Zn-finger/Zn-ribbon topoisomerase 1
VNARARKRAAAGGANLGVIYGDGERCPACGTGRLRARQVTKEGGLNRGRWFLGCDNADCRHAEFREPMVEPLPGHGDVCPACGVGRLLTRALGGVRLLTCSAYPECKHGEWPEGA